MGKVENNKCFGVILSASAGIEGQMKNKIQKGRKMLRILENIWGWGREQCL